MATDSDTNLDRIADSLESIALAFLGPREAFIEINGEQLKAVILAVLGIWGTVKTELEKFNPPPGTSSTLAASARGVSPTLATPVRGGQATVFPRGGLLGDLVFQVGGFVTFFDPRAEARSRLRKLLPPVQAEINFLCPFRNVLKDEHEVIGPPCPSSPGTPVNFDPDDADDAQDVYREVARRTTEVAGQTREGLNGVKDFLDRFNIKLEEDNEFKGLKTALEKLENENVSKALAPKNLPSGPPPPPPQGGGNLKPPSGGGKKKD